MDIWMIQIVDIKSSLNVVLVSVAPFRLYFLENELIKSKGQMSSFELLHMKGKGPFVTKAVLLQKCIRSV
jgi:hypothetical protein